MIFLVLMLLSTSIKQTHFIDWTWRIEVKLIVYYIFIQFLNVNFHHVILFLWIHPNTYQRKKHWAFKTYLLRRCTFRLFDAIISFAAQVIAHELIDNQETVIGLRNFNHKYCESVFSVIWVNWRCVKRCYNKRSCYYTSSLIYFI